MCILEGGHIALRVSRRFLPQVVHGDSKPCFGFQGFSGFRAYAVGSGLGGPGLGLIRRLGFSGPECCDLVSYGHGDLTRVT